MYWDCSCIESYAAKHPDFKIADHWWKEIESHEVDLDDEGLPSPIVAIPANPEKSEQTGLFSAAVDGYCPVDCQVQFYSLLGFMFIAGLIGSTTRLPNTIISLRTIDKRDKVRQTLIVTFLINMVFISKSSQPVCHWSPYPNLTFPSNNTVAIFMELNMAYLRTGSDCPITNPKKQNAL